MSSKSRKHSSPSSDRKSGAKGATSAEHAAVEPDPKAFEVPDELIHAPKEVSKLRFVLMILLVIFLLIIFVVPGALDSWLRRAQSIPIAFEWERPGHGRETVDVLQLQTEHRALRSAFQIDPLIRYRLNSFDREVTREDAIRIHILAALAEDAGVRVTKESLARHLKETVVDVVYRGDIDAFRQNVVAVNTSDRVNVDDIIARCLRAARFLEIAGYAGAVPHPDDIEELWNAEHVEVALDYVVLETSAYEDEARAEIPDDAALEAWLDERPEYEKADLYTEETRTFDLVVYRDAETTPATGLLETYPNPGEEAVDADAQAEDYYNRVYSRRFVKPTEDSGDGEDEDATPKPTEHFAFEEVRDACLAEAPIYFAMQRCVEDLRSRADGGEEIDLAAEASKLGLELITLTSESRDSLAEHDLLGDPAVVSTVFAAPIDAFSFNVAASAKVLAFAHVIESVGPELRPLADVRDEVVDMWVKPRKEELAVAALREIWIGFEKFVPDEAGFDNRVHRKASDEEFRAAVEAAGLTVAHRDYLDRGKNLGIIEDEDPTLKFLRTNTQFARMAEDEVGEPTVGRERERVYLVRVSGTREVPIDRMSPRDYERYLASLKNSAQYQLARTIDLGFLEREYGLVIVDREREADEETGAEEADAADADAADGE